MRKYELSDFDLRRFTNIYDSGYSATRKAECLGVSLPVWDRLAGEFRDLYRGGQEEKDRLDDKMRQQRMAAMQASIRQREQDPRLMNVHKYLNSLNGPGGEYDWTCEKEYDDKHQTMCYAVVLLIEALEKVESFFRKIDIGDKAVIVEIQSGYPNSNTDYLIFDRDTCRLTFQNNNEGPPRDLVIAIHKKVRELMPKVASLVYKQIEHRLYRCDEMIGGRPRKYLVGAVVAAALKERSESYFRERGVKPGKNGEYTGNQYTAELLRSMLSETVPNKGTNSSNATKPISAEDEARRRKSGNIMDDTFKRRIAKISGTTYEELAGVIHVQVQCSRELLVEYSRSWR
jgi:hypothetical protein